MDQSNWKSYIGDAVYVEFDGYGFTLKANDFNCPSDIIYLEPEVLQSLIKFAEQIKNQIKENQIT